MKKKFTKKKKRECPKCGGNLTDSNLDGEIVGHCIQCGAVYRDKTKQTDIRKWVR